MVHLATDPNSKEAGLGLARAIAANGMRTPPLREIGEAMNASAPTVHRWLGGGGHRLLSRAVGAYLSVILDIMRDRTTARGPAGFIPTADVEFFPIRALLAFEEIGRSDEKVAETIAEAWRELSLILGNTLRKSGPVREAVILRGLWTSICDGCDPMTLDDASRIWVEEVVSQRASAA